MRAPWERKERVEALQKTIRDNAERYKRVFSTPDGKAVLDDLRKRSFVDKTTYDPDIKKMSLHEGRRSLYVYISNLVNKEVESIITELKNET
jgi:hypothetical protein